MPDLLVFAGTSEGRRLIEQLAARGASVCASVATEYGKMLLPEGVRVFAERLDTDGMTTMLQTIRFDCVIDATHPYAAAATENIKAACAVSGVRYLRLSRPESRADGCVYAENAQKAAELLSALTGRVLLTTGSKELDKFTSVPGFESRIYPRVLPTLESVDRCLSLGYQIQNLIAMQGPFTREMNCATMRQIGASILVTKESGEAGGFLEKLNAAHDVGATAIVIGRPRDEKGFSEAEILELLEMEYELRPEPRRKLDAPRFPLFADLSGKKIAIFGGGAAAARRASALAPFCGRMVAIAPQFDAAFQTVDIPQIERAYLRGDCAGCDFVLAATENRDVNRAIYEEAKAAGIFVFVADSLEESDFLLPTVVHRDGVVIGACAENGDRKLELAALEKGGMA